MPKLTGVRPLYVSTLWPGTNNKLETTPNPNPLTGETPTPTPNPNANRNP